MEELERDELRVCPRCGGAPTVGLWFDRDGSYIVEVRCARCRYEVSGVDIKIAIDAWNARWLLWKKELKDCRMKFVDS